MNSSEIKKMLLSSLNNDPEAEEVAEKLEEAGVSYDFSSGFTSKVLNRIFSVELEISREIEFSRYLNLAFSRIAFTSIAAIVLLLLSIFLMEGSISFNSILGLGNSQDESIVCLLTGN